jgi:hypothetical protein
MPKPMYVWSGSAWVSVATEVESLAGFATQSYADNTPGMRLVVPSSVAVGSGSGSVATQGTVTFSGASSVSLNDVFSATYDNYLIFVNIDSASTDALVNMRMRVSGTDNSSNNYYWAYGYAAYTGAAALVNKNSAGLTSSFEVGYSDGSVGLNVYNPFKSFKTIIGKLLGLNNDNDVHYGGGGNMSVTTSYTGFTVYPVSGTITGTVQVYGYKD